MQITGTYTFTDTLQRKNKKKVLFGTNVLTWLSSVARLLIINASLNCLNRLGGDLSVIFQNVG